MGLMSFLTPRNLQYLDVLLDIVLDMRSPGVAQVWQTFGNRFGALARDAVSEAVDRLSQLHRIVRQQRGER
jgi:hypothetical protein